MEYSRKIILFFIFILFIILKFISESSEDNCHKKIHSDVNNIKDSPIIKIKFKNKKDFLKIKENILNNDIFIKYFNQIKRKKPTFTLCKEEILNGYSNIMNVFFGHKKIFLVLNHYYLSGESFLYLKSFIMNQQVTCIEKQKKNIMFLLPYFIKDYISIMTLSEFKQLPRYNNQIEPNRYYSNRHFKKNEYENRDKFGFVIYKILSEIYESINIERPMRVLIPIPFDRRRKITNNVGIILLLFNGNETIDDFCEYFNSKKYMKYVTNYFLVHKINSIFTNSINIRENIDVVLSSFYSNDTSNYTIHWTTKVMPIEPIYCSIYSRYTYNSIYTNITYTSSTPQFKKNKNLKIYKI